MEFISALGLIVAVIFTFMIWSYLYKESFIFRIAEYTFIGMASGHAVVMAVGQITKTLGSAISVGQYIWVIPAILGLMIYTRYYKPTVWISRLPVALLVGVGTGLAMRGLIEAQFITQIISTIQPKETIDGIIIAILTMCTLTYFIFTWEPKGGSTRKAYNSILRIGRITIMVAMGAAFGVLATTRLTLCVSRLQFIVNSLSRLIAG
ncbi:hypothetical protein KEJ34_08330 [Candidatus Bathyarchaeota archaeon]|nr:hypothetical protein [Candidatus Bathyarchaeota archaeon]